MTTRKSWYGARDKYTYPGCLKDYRKGYGGGHVSGDSWTRDQNIYVAVLQRLFSIWVLHLKDFKYVLLKNILKNQSSYTYLLIVF